MVKVKAWEPTSLLVNWETPSFAGGLTEFDLCGSKDKPPLCELLSASKRRLVHEAIFKFMSYSLGLQVSLKRNRPFPLATSRITPRMGIRLKITT